MIVSILPGGQPGSGWRQPRQKVALAMRLLIFAVGGLTAYAVSHCDMSAGFATCVDVCRLTVLSGFAPCHTSLAYCKLCRVPNIYLSVSDLP